MEFSVPGKPFALSGNIKWLVGGMPVFLPQRKTGLKHCGGTISDARRIATGHRHTVEALLLQRTLEILHEPRLLSLARVPQFSVAEPPFWLAAWPRVADNLGLPEEGDGLPAVWHD